MDATTAERRAVVLLHEALVDLLPDGVVVVARPETTGRDPAPALAVLDRDSLARSDLEAPHLVVHVVGRRTRGDLLRAGARDVGAGAAAAWVVDPLVEDVDVLLPGDPRPRRRRLTFDDDLSVEGLQVRLGAVLVDDVHARQAGRSDGTTAAGPATSAAPVQAAVDEIRVAATGPAAAVARAWPLLTAAFVGFWLYTAVSGGAPWWFVLFGVITAALLVGQAWSNAQGITLSDGRLHVDRAWLPDRVLRLEDVQQVALVRHHESAPDLVFSTTSGDLRLRAGLADERRLLSALQRAGVRVLV